MKKYKLGKDWKNVHGIFINKKGTRVHLLGLIRHSDGRELKLNSNPEGYKFIRILGDNRRRGLLAWAVYHERAAL